MSLWVEFGHYRGEFPALFSFTFLELMGNDLILFAVKIGRFALTIGLTW